MANSNTALLVGRFQPFHFGHLYLIKKALASSDGLIIGIGSSNKTDVKNPLSWRVRKRVLEKVIKEEKLNGKIKKIVPLEDFFDDKKWFSNVVKKSGGFDLVVGNNNWVNRIMKKGGKRVMRVPYYKRYLYEGEKIRRLIADGLKWEVRVPNYLVGEINKQLEKIKYDQVVLGGTFDHFHKGHKALIKEALRRGRNITMGVATRELYKNKLFSEAIENYELRKRSVVTFLRKNQSLSRAKIITFSDFKADLDRKKNVDAIVVSRLSYPNALKINRLRLNNGLDPLKIFVINDVLSDDKKLLSSERIRLGEIDRSGMSYLSLFKKTLFLPRPLRQQLREPLGKILKNTDQALKFISKSRPLITIAVGDIIAQELEKNKFIPDVKIIDYRSRRQAINVSKERAQTHNEAGSISSKTAKIIDLVIKNRTLKSKTQTLVVSGEEDLLALPAIVLSPLNALVLYGQWDLGVIAVSVTEESKEKVVDLLKKFN